MRFPAPLIQGRLIQRYKRFLSDIELDQGGTITAHCANPGSMLGLARPGMRVWLSRSADPKRKLAHSWELVEAEGTLVGINTGHPNALVAEAIADGTIAEVQGYATLRREVKYGRNSRIDILLEDDARGRAYVEVKNVHFSRAERLAEFPDSVTARGAKHLEELGDQVEEGHRAVMVYLIQRGDAERFRLAADLDPTYARAFERAASRGVEMLAYACSVAPEEIAVARPVPVEF